MNKTILTLLLVLFAISAQAQTELNQWLDQIAPRFQRALDEAK